MSKEIAIEVKNLSKHFRLPVEQARGIKQAAINRVKGIKGYKDQKVLRDISFNVEKGDFFGIVGRNGSGKSTLLKLISNIYNPDSGTVTINGSLVSFIELGVGFNPELTGRENVYLNGALLGFSNEEIDEMYDDIVDFAELAEFMDQKLKNYSSGMQVRLAFSCAIRAKSDILVLDEVLAVGDEAFQRKCYNYFATLKKNKKTVVLVTHDMGSVQQFCNKAMMIEAGKIVENGNSAKVAQCYRELFMGEGNIGVRTKDNNITNEDVSTKIYFQNDDDNLLFDIMVEPKVNIEDPIIALIINRDNGEMVYRWASDDDMNTHLQLEKGVQFKVRIRIRNVFPDGRFSVNFAIKKRDRTREYAMFDGIIEFEIAGTNAHWKPKTEVVYERQNRRDTISSEK
jgi:ABC-2 type transport system ATP-binding protein